MDDQEKTKGQLVEELREMRQRVAELEALETERKRMEEQLQYQANLLQNVSDAIISTDMDFKILSWSKAAGTIYGWQADEVIGKVMGEVVPTEYLYDWREEVVERFLEKGYWRGEVIQKRKDGTPINILSSVSLLKDSSGNPVGAVAVNRDITERKRAEEALRESEGRYRSLIDDVIDTSPAGIFILDKSFRVVWVNQALERFFGLRGDKVIGRDKRELIRERIKYSFEDPEAFAETVLATYDNNIYVENFECHVLPDGEREERWLEHWSRPIQSGLYAGGRVELYYDITKRNWAEEALRESRQLLEKTLTSLHDAVFFIDADMVEILDCNLAASEIFGYRCEEMLGRITALLHVDETALEEFKGHLYPAVEEKGFLALPEFMMKRRDGTIFPTEHSVMPLEDEQGRRIGWVSVVRDITERKRAEEALRRRKTQLEALREVGLELAAELDLNTLLHSIVSQAIELLGETSGGLYLYWPERDVLEWTVGVGPALAPVGAVLHRGEGLSGKVWETGKPLIVDDYQHWEGRAALYEGYPFTAVIGVPIRWGEELLGVLDVLADSPRTFSPADAELLNLFATQVAIAIRNARLYNQAQQEITERKRAEERIKAALAEKEVLLKEVHHRVKNNLQVLMYLIDMQADYITDPQVLQMFRGLQERTRAMALVHERLYQTEDLARIDFGEYLEDLTTNLFHALAGGRPISLLVDAEDLFINVNMAIPCGLIVNELVINALKYAFPACPEQSRRRDLTGLGEPVRSDCEIRVEFKLREGEYVLMVSDNGVGLPPGLDWRTTESLGLKLVDICATHQLGGSIELDTHDGTTFKITFAERRKGD